MAIHVRMDASETARWPARCVRCNAHDPREVYTMRLVRRHWYGPRRAPDVVVAAPACTLCVGALKSAKFWRMFFIFFPGVVLALLGMYLAQTNVLSGRLWDRWAVKVFGLAGALPGVIFHLRFPLPIDIELEKRRKRGGRATVDKVSYEFASDDLAREFMVMNSGRMVATKGLWGDPPGEPDAEQSAPGTARTASIDPRVVTRNDRA